MKKSEIKILHELLLELIERIKKIEEYFIHNSDDELTEKKNVDKNNSHFIPRTSFDTYYTWPGLNTLRYWCWNRPQKGLEEVFLKKDNLWYIDTEKFDLWMKKNYPNQEFKRS